MWCITRITAEYRRRMYRLLDLYEKPYDERYPVVCVDEKSKQLIRDLRGPIKKVPEGYQLHDYEYKRNGTRNIFVAVEPQGGFREVQVTKTRTKWDFAMFIKYLLDTVYPNALKLKLVMDNLNTHFMKSFYETFAKEEADAILNRLEFYYTPKHGSWLNMAEIEINALERECIGGRIGSVTALKREVEACANQRNIEGKTINWSFTKRDAYRKLSKHFVA